jgi:hypothetical protein
LSGARSDSTLATPAGLTLLQEESRHDARA